MPVSSILVITGFVFAFISMYLLLETARNKLGYILLCASLVLIITGVVTEETKKEAKETEVFAPPVHMTVQYICPEGMSEIKQNVRLICDSVRIVDSTKTIYMGFDNFSYHAQLWGDYITLEDNYGHLLYNFDSTSSIYQVITERQ